MSDALRMAVVRLATDPAAYQALLRDPEHALADVPEAERRMLLAGDTAALASALAAPAYHPAAPTWIPGWPQGVAWSAGPQAGWPASYAQLPGWPLR